MQSSHLTRRMVAPKGRYDRRQWTSLTSLVPSILSSFLLLVLGSVLLFHCYILLILFYFLQGVGINLFVCTLESVNILF